MPPLKLLPLLIGAGCITGFGYQPPIEECASRGEWQEVANADLSVITDRIWVRVRSPISIKELAGALDQDEANLAKLNNVAEDHEFNSDDWLVLPSQTSKKVKTLAAINSSELRRTPPLASSPEAQEPARIRFGDTLAQVAKRYNLSIVELLRLNPGLQAANLVAGTQIRVSSSTPGRSRMILGLKPTSSGGLRWPEPPESDDYQEGSGISSIGLVGPFKRNPQAFARFLNSKPKAWEDPSLHTYFYDLYNCYSYPGDSSNTMPQSYKCTGGYVNYSDNLGSRRCRVSSVSWTWKEGQAFEASGCR